MKKFFQANLFLERNIFRKGYEIIPNELILKEYSSIGDNKIYNSISKKLQRIQLVLEKYISENKNEIFEKVNQEYKYRILNIASSQIAKEESKVKFIQTELSKNCKISLKKFFESKIPSITNLYYNFLVNLNDYMKEKSNRFDKKSKENAKNIKSKKIEFEDISALIYLKCKFAGNDEFKKYVQVAIDEAQDYGEFTFLCLKELLSNSHFSIFGDLAQSIYQYRSIKNWECVKESVKMNKKHA